MARGEKAEPRYPDSGQDEVVAHHRGRFFIGNPLNRRSGSSVRGEQFVVRKAGPQGSESLTVDEYVEQRGKSMMDDLRAVLGDEEVDRLMADAAETGWTADDQEQFLRTLIAPRTETHTYIADGSGGYTQV